MQSTPPATHSEVRGVVPNGPTETQKPARLIELDILRGFLLLWMTLTHLPTKVSVISNQTFGFVSGAEGFIFLAGFMVGQLENRIEQKRGASGVLRDISKRTLRIYVYHCALLALAFTVVAHIAISYHRPALQNLLSFYIQSPKHALIAALILEYRPSLLDILPIYIVFMAITPLARKIAKRWSWDVVVYASFFVWAFAQFGLRAWLYRKVDIFGLGVPETSTGAFDLYAWQLLWMVGLALGSIYTKQLIEPEPPGSEKGKGVPRWLFILSAAMAAIFFTLRYSPVDHWIDPNVYGWLIDKWHLGPARVINFTVLTILLTRFGARIAALPVVPYLAILGQASIEVFCMHIVCCFAGISLSRDADPQLPWYQQVLLLAVTLTALFVTGLAHRRWIQQRNARRKQAR